MAILEIVFADHAKLKKDGRNFDCATCPRQIMKLRRCEEDREDFTAKDSSVFPIQLREGGRQFSFCPAKAFRDYNASEMFNILMITAKTGVLWKKGAIGDQPAWYIDLLGEFLISYDNLNFASKAAMVLGDGGSNKPNGSHKQKR